MEEPESQTLSNIQPTIRQITENPKSKRPSKKVLVSLIAIIITMLLLSLIWLYSTLKQGKHIVIISWNNTQSGYPHNLQNLQSQTYRNWQAIYFRPNIEKQITAQNMKIEKCSKSPSQDIKNLIKSKANEKIIFLLLNEDENFTSVQELSKISNAFDNENIIAGVMDFNLQNSTKRAFSYFAEMRIPFISINLLNYFRIFRCSGIMGMENDINKYFQQLVQDNHRQQEIIYFNWPVYTTKRQAYLIQNQGEAQLDQQKQDKEKQVKKQQKDKEKQEKQKSQNKFQLLPVSQNSNQPIQFCILSVRSSNYDNFELTLQSIQSQTYKNWKFWLFQSNTNETQEKVSRILQIFANRVHLQNSSGNQGQDVYDGIVNKCSYHSVIVFLNEGEIFYNQKVLEKYRTYFQDQKIYMIAAPFQYKGSKIDPVSEQLSKFRRDDHFPMQDFDVAKIKELSLNMMQTIRLVRSQIYQRLSYVDLMYQNQTFYSEKVSFLYPLIQFRCIKECVLNKNQVKTQLPQVFTIINEGQPFYKSQQLEQIKNQEQFLLIGRKMIYLTAQHILEYASNKHPNGKPPSNNPLMWDAHLNVLERNISNTQKIPRKVHQIWIGNQIPIFKQKFMKTVKTIIQADGFQYRLWGNQDITTENFPITYEILQKIIQIDKTSKYPKQAMIADLMRLEIIFHHGGFYIDTNYELFKSIIPFLKYPFVGMMEMSPSLGEYLANSFFGAQKNSKFLKRLLEPQILASIDLNAMLTTNYQTGPWLLARGFYAQDYYFQVKIYPNQLIYPYIRWAIDRRYGKNRCSFSKNSQIPQNLQGKYDQIIIANQYKILHPCRLYPNAYGMDYWNLGTSWRKPRF